MIPKRSKKPMRMSFLCRTIRSRLFPSSSSSSSSSYDAIDTTNTTTTNSSNSIHNTPPSPPPTTTPSPSTSSTSSIMLNWYNAHCIYLLPMLGWFLFSALLSSYNKYVFGSQHLQFPCPLLLTSIHFTCQWFYSFILSSTWPMTFGGIQISNISWKIFLHISIPCGFVAAADVGFSNLALVRITLTFYTMVKASSPIFVLFSAYIFGITRITYTLIGVVFIIFIGELFTVYGEISFDMIGFILCAVATIMAGMRWTLVEYKLRDIQPPLKSSVAIMRILSPVMSMAMFFLSMVWEQPWKTLHQSTAWNQSQDVWKLVLLGLIGAFLAICMMSCEFYLLLKSSAIILMIGGVIKELLNIFVGVVFFHDPINAINAGGCLIVFTGVILYKASLIYTNNNNHHHHSETYSPIDQENNDIDIHNDNRNNELGVLVQGGKVQLHDDGNSSQNTTIPHRSIISRPRIIERTSSSVGSGQTTRGPSLSTVTTTTSTNSGTMMEYDSPIIIQQEIDEFLEEGLQDKMLKLKL